MARSFHAAVTGALVSSHSQKDNEFRENASAPGLDLRPALSTCRLTGPQGSGWRQELEQGGTEAGPRAPGAVPWVACISQGLWCPGAWNGPPGASRTERHRAGARPAEPSRTPGVHSSLLKSWSGSRLVLQQLIPNSQLGPPSRPTDACLPC